MGKRKKMYVAYVCENLRDGHEESARIFERLDDALAWINKDRWPGPGNFDYALFELGKQIPLDRVETVEQQPPVTTQRYAVRKGRQNGQA